jgi:hypothetical protein
MAIARENDGNRDDLKAWVATLPPASRWMWAGDDESARQIVREVEKERGKHRGRSGRGRRSAR